MGGWGAKQSGGGAWGGRGGRWGRFGRADRAVRGHRGLALEQVGLWWLLAFVTVFVGGGWCFGLFCCVRRCLVIWFAHGDFD